MANSKIKKICISLIFLLIIPFHSLSGKTLYSVEEEDLTPEERAQVIKKVAKCKYTLQSWLPTNFDILNVPAKESNLLNQFTVPNCKVNGKNPQICINNIACVYDNKYAVTFNAVLCSPQQNGKCKEPVECLKDYSFNVQNTSNQAQPMYWEKKLDGDVQ